MTITATPVALRLSADRKVSPIVRRQGSKDAPALYNSFGLPAGVSCPGKTEFCTSCYAANTENAFPSAGALVQANYDRLKACGSSITKIRDVLDGLMFDFHAQFDKLRASGRATDDDAIFRIHWDGDFYSRTYARAWAMTVRDNPDVQFWSYTRSFDYVDVLAGIPNLTLYLSVDRHNVRKAQRVLSEHPGVLVAFCAETQAEAAMLAAMMERKPVACPENVGRIPLVMHSSGKRSDTLKPGEDGQGACAACRLCVDGVRDVAFATKKR